MFNNTVDLLKQIALGEDSVLELKTIEFKGDQVAGPHRNSMADELAAMANTATGVILLGVDDKSKAIVGIPMNLLDVVETWLRGICNDLIEPLWTALFAKFRLPPKIGMKKSLFAWMSPEVCSCIKVQAGIFVGSAVQSVR